jgi:hypothetical protein
MGMRMAAVQEVWRGAALRVHTEMENRAGSGPPARGLDEMVEHAAAMRDFLFGQLAGPFDGLEWQLALRPGGAACARMLHPCLEAFET